jgi:hypothetical protein
MTLRSGQVAAALGVTARTVAQWDRDGRLPEHLRPAMDWNLHRSWTPEQADELRELREAGLVPLPLTECHAPDGWDLSELVQVESVNWYESLRLFVVRFTHRDLCTTSAALARKAALTSPMLARARAAWVPSPLNDGSKFWGLVGIEPVLSEDEMDAGIAGLLTAGATRE